MSSIGSQHIETQSDRDTKYIIGVAVMVVVPQVLRELKAQGRVLDPKIFFKSIQPLLVVQVMRMTDETLGKICGFGTPKGVHRIPDEEKDPSNPPKFIRMTGYEDFVGTYVDEGGFRKWPSSTGRDIMIWYAQATLGCILRDVILQREYMDEWAKIEPSPLGGGC